MGKKSRKKRGAEANELEQQAQAPGSGFDGAEPGEDAAAPARAGARSAPSMARPGRAPVRLPAARDEFNLLDELPALGLGALCAILPCVVKVGLRDLFQLPKTFAMTYGAGWLLAIVAVLAIAGRPLRWNRTPLKWPLIALALSIAVGVAIAPDETGGELSIFAKMDAYRWGAALLIFALGLVTIQRPRHLAYVLGGMTLGGVLVAIYGIAQHHNIRGLLPEDADRWVAINAPGSTFGNRNMAAQLIVSVMPAAYVALAMGLRWWRRARVELALAASIGASAVLVALLYYLRLSVTRSAWGGAVLGVIVIGAIAAIGYVRGRRDERQDAEPAREEVPGHDGGRRKVWPLALGLAVSAALVLVVATSALDSSGYKASYDAGRGDSKRQSSVLELLSTAGDFKGEHWDLRFMMWATTWEAIKDRPLGGGAGNWRVLFPKHVVRRTANKHFTIARQPVRAHQDFLQFWSEFGTQGILSLLALLLIAGWMGTRVVQRWWRPDMRDRDDVAWMSLGALAGVGGLVAICGDALLSFPLQLPAPTFFFAVHLAVVGASWSYVRRIGEPEQPAEGAVVLPGPQPVQPGIKVGLVVAALASVIFVHQTNDRLLEAEWGFTRGRSLQKRGEPAQGLAEIQKAIAINPDDFQNHFIEALCYNSQRRMPEALASMERSLALYPNLLNAWVNMALFARKAGEQDKMLHAVEMALALKPDETYVLDIKADYLMRRGQQDKVAALYEPHLDGWNNDNEMPNRNYLDKLAQAYEKTGQWAKRGAIYEMMIAHYKMTDHLRGGKANNASNRKRMADQRERYFKDRLEYWDNAASSYERAGLYDKEVAMLQKAASWVKNTHGDIKRRYAVALARVKRWDKAEHELGVALSVDPSQKTALLRALGTMKLEASGEDARQLDRLIGRANAP